MAFVQMEDPGMNPQGMQARTPPTPNTSSWRIRVRSSPPYRREVSSRSCGLLPSTSQSSKYKFTRPTCTSQTFANSVPVSRVDADRDGATLRRQGRLHGQVFHLGIQVFFDLVARFVKMLLEVALVVEQTNRHQRDTQTAGTLDVVARQDAQAAGVDRHRFVNAELGGEIRHRLAAQDTRVRGSPTCACRPYTPSVDDRRG